MAQISKSLDSTILDQMEDFITNNYQEPMSSSDKAEMFEHLVSLLDQRKQTDEEDDPICGSCFEPASKHSNGADDFSHCPNTPKVSQ